MRSYGMVTVLLIGLCDFVFCTRRGDVVRALLLFCKGQRG
jgi:hypothetical protein